MKTKITYMDYSYFKIYYSDCIFRTFALNAGDALEALQQEMGWEELPVIEGIQQETLNGYISIDMKRKAIN